MRQKNFWFIFPKKKVRLSYGNLRISRSANFKTGLFYRVKELFKSNQTRYGVSPVQLERKTKKIGIAVLGKKLGCHTEICEFRD